ncbi:hypothetical protein ACFYST_29820 [Kitasatospora sp. NPDC004614]|uniref:hypothetical protein n=1 Tax=unclassified Kitasatospora TaxID=2633591 RepID=UPI00369AB6AC
MTRLPAPQPGTVRAPARTALRPAPAQVSRGALIATATTVALLAVSGETGVWRVAVLVAFAIALGTLSAVLLTPRPHLPAALKPAAPKPVARPEPARQPEYANQSR